MNSVLDQSSGGTADNNHTLTDDDSIDATIALHKKSIVESEKELWKGIPSKKNIARYQDSFIELEKLYGLKSQDDRYSFKIVIPVADRPQHLKHCLDSLLTLCQRYRYGGFKDNTYKKISVLIADDSKEKDNIELNKNYCAELTNAGVKTEYFGLEDQLSLISDITRNNKSLKNIVPYTSDIDDISDYSHKGASNMRNISYLKLNRDLDNNTLIYFIDSDQEFCITADYSDGNLFAINYFHYLNENFKTQDIAILTGKVVGDPPVSPAVMAGNFQGDVKNFLNTMSKLSPEQSCQFHQHEKHRKDDAAYHDMANLFGFEHNDLTFNYHCTLSDSHNNAKCFNDFADKLGHFFYGEHPTRKTFFDYEEGFTALTPARTVYTGNYVIKPEALCYFIPFASLKLRMAGPVLGRILQAKLGDKFVSANLPMLHNRTVDSTGQSEFRAGVENENTSIDLGDEFIRQFYGDVMLFLMVEITRSGYPDTVVNEDSIAELLNATYLRIKDSYIDKHNTILNLKSELDTIVTNSSQWWNKKTENKTNDAKRDFEVFLKNIQLNFDDDTEAYLQITSTDKANKYLADILRAILQYQKDLSNWKKIID